MLLCSLSKLSPEGEAKGCKKSAAYEERKRTCYHEFLNLSDQCDLWWWKKKEINGIKWIAQAQFCGGMFFCWRGIILLWVGGDDIVCKDEIPLSKKLK